MGSVAQDTYMVLKAKADKSLAAKMSRDISFPRGLAGRSVILTHMQVEGYSDEHIEQAARVLSAAGIG